MPDKTKEMLIDFLMRLFTREELISIWVKILPSFPAPIAAEITNLTLIQQLIENCESDRRLSSLFTEIERLRPGRLDDKRDVDLVLFMEKRLSADATSEAPMDLAVTIDGGEPYVREPIRLDVATPSSIVVDMAFDMAVAVLQTKSQPLSVKGLPNIVSTEGEIMRSTEDQPARYRVEIVPSTYFDVQPSSYTFRLTPGVDSMPFFFQLVAKAVGELSLVLNAFQVDQGVVVASTRLVLNVCMHIGESQTDNSMPDSFRGKLLPTYSDATGIQRSSGSDLSERPAELMRLDLLRKLDEGYSKEELIDLCFVLGVDFDNLSGDTKRSKARDLILFQSRRGDLPHLIALIAMQRPPLA